MNKDMVRRLFLRMTLLGLVVPTNLFISDKKKPLIPLSKEEWDEIERKVTKNVKEEWEVVFRKYAIDGVLTLDECYYECSRIIVRKQLKEYLVKVVEKLGENECR